MVAPWIKKKRTRQREEAVVESAPAVKEAAAAPAAPAPAAPKAAPAAQPAPPAAPAPKKKRRSSSAKTEG